MANEFARCQYIDPSSQIECESWYPYDGIKFCHHHRENGQSKEGIHIPRTVKVISDDQLQELNTKVLEFEQKTIPELADHIRNIEDQIRLLERDRRAANMAKRNLEDKLTDEERASLREQSANYHVLEDRPVRRKVSNEEKASKRKEGFPAWAARLGVNIDDLMAMDEDEMAARIAKYKKARE